MTDLPYLGFTSDVFEQRPHSGGFKAEFSAIKEELSEDIKSTEQKDVLLDYEGIVGEAPTPDGRQVTASTMANEATFKIQNISPRERRMMHSTQQNISASPINLQSILEIEVASA